MTSTISKIPFLVGQRVKHVKTGNIYTIIRHARCEKSLDAEMHDGRFEFIEEKE